MNIFLLKLRVFSPSRTPIYCLQGSLSEVPWWDIQQNNIQLLATANKQPRKSRNVEYAGMRTQVCSTILMHSLLAVLLLLVHDNTSGRALNSKYSHTNTPHAINVNQNSSISCCCNTSVNFDDSFGDSPCWRVPTVTMWYKLTQSRGILPLDSLSPWASVRKSYAHPIGTTPCLLTRISGRDTGAVFSTPNYHYHRTLK